MSSVHVAILGALWLAAVAGIVLVSSLVSTSLILRRISTRLGALQLVLDAITEATDPLTARVAGIAGNVRDLRDASAALNRVVAERSQ